VSVLTHGFGARKIFDINQLAGDFFCGIYKAMLCDVLSLPQLGVVEGQK